MSNSMLIMLAGLLGEIVLLALVLLTVAYLRNRAQRKRDLKAVKMLIARIKDGKAERENTIVRFLEQGMGLSGEALQQAKVATLRAELGMLQRIAGVYRLREAAALARMDDDLFAAIGPYHALASAPAEAAAGDAGPANDDELEVLRKENQRLSEELTITMETMGRMLNEYSAMFAGGAPEVAASTAAETLDDDEVMIASTGADEASAAADDGQATAVDAIAEVAQMDETDEVEIAASVNPDDDGGTEVGGVADGIEIGSVDQDARPADDVIVADAPAAVEQDPDAVPDASVEDDEIAAILREAQSQEVSARGGTEPAGDVGAGDELASADVMVTEQDPPAVDRDAAAGAGTDPADELDKLFDAAGDVIVDGGEKRVDVPAEGEPPLTSQGGG